MSNQTVGAVYAQIIADVIDSSRVDFEEMGVEESVLEDLKKVSIAESTRFQLHNSIQNSAEAWIPSL